MSLLLPDNIWILFFLPSTGPKTRWNNLVPIKVNILLWRIGWNKIPTRMNLLIKGVEMGETCCPICQSQGESSDHLFAGCNLIIPLWSRIAVWWQVDLPDVLTVYSLFNWVDGARLTALAKQMFDAVVKISFWFIWGYRNRLIFGTDRVKRDEIFDDIVAKSFFWICNRNNRLSIF